MSNSSHATNPAAIAPNRRDLKIAVTVALSGMLLMMPIGSFLVFYMGFDRVITANAMCLTYLVSFYSALLVPWLPIPSLAKSTSHERMEIMVFIWFWVSFSTAATWELIWLLFTDAIRNARDQAWAYSWWAWIDGGDYRYAGFDAIIVTIEWETVVLGAIGTFGLWKWYKSPAKPHIPAVLMFMFTAVGHLYGTTLYYVSEILAGFPHTNANSLFDVLVKYFLVNSAWVVMPIFVLIWGSRTILRITNANQKSG